MYLRKHINSVIFVIDLQIIRSFKMVCKNILTYRNRIKCSLNEIEEDIRNAIGISIKKLQITYRVKDSGKLREKMQLKNTPDVFSIKDVYGIRIIVESVNDVYFVLAKISERFFGFLKHDYIISPKTRPNEPKFKGKMVRFLQFIAYKNGAPFEIQITTTAFHEMNESLHEEYHRRKYPT